MDIEVSISTSTFIKTDPLVNSVNISRKNISVLDSDFQEVLSTIVDALKAMGYHEDLIKDYIHLDGI
jgi:hypothetical protein